MICWSWIGEKTFNFFKKKIQKNKKKKTKTKATFDRALLTVIHY
jgi:hypothetical protein